MMLFEWHFRIRSLNFANGVFECVFYAILHSSNAYSMLSVVHWERLFNLLQVMKIDIINDFSSYFLALKLHINWIAENHRQLFKPTHNIYVCLILKQFFWFDVRIPHTISYNKWFSEKMWNIWCGGLSVKWKLNSLKYYVYLFNLLKIYIQCERSQFTDCFIWRDRKKKCKVIIEIENGLTWLCDFFFRFAFMSLNHYFISINLLLANFLWHLVLDWYLS